MGDTVDYRCYLVTAADDPVRVVDTAVRCARAGAGVVQVRSKPISARDLYHLSCAVAHAVHEVAPTTRTLVDDRVDVALAARAAGAPIAGVHLGQDDIPVRAARALLGPDAIIGLTTGTRELVAAANEVADVIDYIGCGPFRPSPTKDSGRAPIGLAGYPELVELSTLPVVAIGDVQPGDAADLGATGVAGVALVRALHHAPDPGAAVQQVLQGLSHV
ncbi:thiamine phosphate synthase [Corynebacterium sp. TAE3-ERU2]|uniref:thiamine phosphate synthase n=1 Tax=Corynebacterium sp. TAE3-ERU2 TaxID=2849497 RepID=UPI001C472FDD|nr:thiamine phosphate synthase [Corynebacterium sp. TAE3-ERU2]MBV7301730.1 thiamine phosphate synthase [Corynebacterium sp. TAE3-ERU2]